MVKTEDIKSQQIEIQTLLSNLFFTSAIPFCLLSVIFPSCQCLTDCEMALHVFLQIARKSTLEVFSSLNV